MPTLHLQQHVADYDDWKRAFDGDPIHMQEGGVRRYRIQRDVSDPNFVLVDLEFDTVERAEGFLQRLRHLWSGTNLNTMKTPPAWVAETVESVEVEPVSP